MEVAGYIRVSTEQQRQEDSHENQRDRLEAWADREDRTIELFEDIAVSGQADERAAYDELMEAAEEYDAVVVRELSRFGRSLQQVLRDIDELNDRDVGFISLKESMIDTTTADGQLFLQIIGAFNEYWANLARERAEAYVERAKERGESIGRPKKLSEPRREQVREWHEENDLGYATIAELVDVQWGIEIDRSTIYRYCQAD